MNSPSEFLQRRKATESETRLFFDHKAACFDEAKRLFPDCSKDRFAHVVKRSREIPLVYSTDLNCIVYIPTHEEVFNDWCNKKKIPQDAREYVREGWFAGKRFYETSQFPDDLKAEIEKARRRKLTDKQLRAQREKYFARYRREHEIV